MIEHPDFSVVVKLRAPPPKSWRWEIYRAGRNSAIEHSQVFFESVTEANRAGKLALEQLLSEYPKWPNARLRVYIRFRKSPIGTRAGSPDGVPARFWKPGPAMPARFWSLTSRLIDKSADIYTAKRRLFEELLKNGDAPEVPFLRVSSPYCASAGAFLI